jgi:hypothetical protein
MSSVIDATASIVVVQIRLMIGFDPIYILDITPPPYRKVRRGWHKIVCLGGGEA